MRRSMTCQSSLVTTLFSRFSSDSSQFRMSQQTCTVCTRRSFCPSVSNDGIIFAQIFLTPRSSVDDLLHPLFVYAQLICYHSNSKDFHSFFLLLASASVIIFHIFSSFFNPPVPLKNPSSGFPCGISINFFAVT